MVKILKTATFCLALVLSGCGYTTQSLLPADIKSVNVAPVKNGIDLSSELSDAEHFRTYRPGVEVEITNALINRFIFDGNLKVLSSDKADALLETTLLSYRRDPLRYSDGEDVQEYRLSITLNVSFKRRGEEKPVWNENIVGDTTFFIAGPRAVTEDEAAAKAVEDVSRRVVEKTIEVW